MPRIQLPLRRRLAWWSLLLSAALGTRSLTKAAIVAGVLESSGKQIPVVWADLTGNIVEPRRHRETR